MVKKLIMDISPLLVFGFPNRRLDEADVKICVVSGYSLSPNYVLSLLSNYPHVIYSFVKISFQLCLFNAHIITNKTGN